MRFCFAQQKRNCAFTVIFSDIVTMIAYRVGGRKQLVSVHFLETTLSGLHDATHALT